MILSKLAKKIGTFFICCITSAVSYAQIANDGLGQNIQIYTRLHSYIGRPSLVLMIRDLDHNVTVPYVFDIQRGDDFWIAFTYGRNYLITAATLQFSPYRHDPYRSKKISDFCHLESHGHIMRGESLYVMITGDLDPTSNRYTCDITHFKDANFTVVPQN